MNRANESTSLMLHVNIYGEKRTESRRDNNVKCECFDWPACVRVDVRLRERKINKNANKNKNKQNLFLFRVRCFANATVTWLFVFMFYCIFNVYSKSVASTRSQQCVAITSDIWHCTKFKIFVAFLLMFINENKLCVFNLISRLLFYSWSNLMIGQNTCDNTFN